MRTINIKSLANSTPSQISFENFCDKPGQLLAMEALADSLSNISMGIEDFSPIGVVARGLVQGRISNEDKGAVAIVAAIVAAVAALLFWVYKKLRGDKDIGSSLDRISRECDAASGAVDGAASKTEEEIKAATDGTEVSIVAADPNVADAAGKLAVPDTEELKNISQKLQNLAEAAKADANSEAAVKAMDELEAELNKRSGDQTASVMELAKSLGLNVHIDPSKPESFEAAIQAINAEMKGKKKVIDSKIIRDIKNGGANLKHNLTLVNNKVAALNKAAENIGRIAEAQDKLAKQMENIKSSGPIAAAFRRASNRIRSVMAGVMLVTNVSGNYASDTNKIVQTAAK